jgi:AmiR/NasT family two-component response regulator
LDGEAPAGLNVHADQPAVYDETAIQAVQRQVFLASKALRLAVRMAHHRDTAADRAAAMASRTTIHLPVGIIMGQNHCPQHEAFEILQAVSNHLNIKLREIAADLVPTVGKGPVATTHFDH